MAGARRRRDERAEPGRRGFFLQPEIADELIRRVYSTGVLAGRVRRRPVGAGARGLAFNAIADTSRATGSRHGGVQTFWQGEGSRKEPSAPKVRRVELELRKLTALVYVADELLQDATALEALLLEAVAEEFGFEVDEVILYGTGTGMPLGIVPSGAAATVPAEPGQEAWTITEANVRRMFTALWPRSAVRAVWLTGPDVVPRLMLAASYLPPGGLAGKPHATLLGRPVLEIEHAAPLGEAGDLMLADLSQYLLIDRPVERATSMHVRFMTDETAFRFVLRVDGQPLWGAPLAPYRGEPQSPFVALAART